MIRQTHSVFSQNNHLMNVVARHLLSLAVVLAVLIFMLAWHISVGAKSLPLDAVFEALFDGQGVTMTHVIVWDLRLPRALTAALVGGGLGVAGALLQGVSRNPLAEPSLLGLMAGASFAVVIAVNTFHFSNVFWLPWVAAVGALVAAVVVWLIAQLAPGGLNSLNLILAGSAVSAFLASLVSVVLILNQETFEQLRVWLSGSLSGQHINELKVAAPLMAVTFLFALYLSSKVTVLAMGEEVALGLGLKTGWLKVQVLICVVVLTACSVALAGPIGFVGLVIPHVVRLFVGVDYRWVIPYSALVGACYLLLVDIIARLALRPEEISTGIVTALFGAPLFVYLVRARAR